MARRLRGRAIRLWSVIAVALLLQALLPVTAAAEAAPGVRPQLADDADKPPARPGQFIVRFRAGVPADQRLDALARVGAQPRAELDAIDASLAEVAPDATADAIESLEKDERVLYAEPNYLVRVMDGPRYPNDPQFPDNWGLDNRGQWADDETGIPDADIDAPEAWEITTGSGDVVVGIIDTGVDFGHPDLGANPRGSPKMWTNPGEDCPGCRENGLDDDGNGYVDDWRGWDWVNDDNNPYDDNGHGTHVAGIIGATGDNGFGSVGVAWEVRLVGLKFLDAAGGGAISDAIEAVDYAADLGIPITNNSWGGFFGSQALYDAIVAAGEQGMLFVAAAGNDAIDTDALGVYPGAYDAPNIISVAATNARDELAWFSNWGSRSVDLAAPGTNIYSSWSGEVGRQYRFLNGTSMATPHVSGAAALALARFPAADGMGLKALILRSVDPIPAMHGISTSGGRLNVNTIVRCDRPNVWVESPTEDFAVEIGGTVAVELVAGYCGDTSVPIDLHVTVNGEPVALTPLGNGRFAGTFTTADIAGPLRLEATASLDGSSDSMARDGRALRNYRYRNVPHEWVDAADGGTRSTIDEDEEGETVALPFGFTFYDEVYEALTISSNGYAYFGRSTPYGFDNLPIPSTLPPNSFVAPFWDDLNPGTGGAIWYRTVGEAPNRRFVVEWRDVPHYYEVGGVTFQLVLEEGTNAITFYYRDVDFGRRDFNDGLSATVGIEQRSGMIGKQLAYNESTLFFYAGRTGVQFLPVEAGYPLVETLALPNGIVGEPYEATLEASGGHPPYTWALVDGALPPGLTFDTATGIVSGTPTATGVFSVEIEVADSSVPPRTGRQVLALEIMPGYTMEDVPFEWVEALDGGLNVGITEEEGYRALDLPFAFTFYDEQFTRITVSSNGYILFGEREARAFSNVAMPNPREPNAIVAPFWDDLSPHIGGGVWYRTVGEAPNRRFVVEWVETPHYREIDAITFQLILAEGTNTITFQYLDAFFDFSVYDYGDAATIGIESPSGTAGKLFSHDEATLQPYEGTKGIHFAPIFTAPQPPVITSVPPVPAIVNQPYSYQLYAYSATPVVWSLVEGPPGMTLDPATGLLAWLPDALGEWHVTVEATNTAGSSRQEFDLVVQAGPTETTELAVVEGYDSRSGQFLSVTTALPRVQVSDNLWLETLPGEWTSLAFAQEVPDNALIQQVSLIVEHHEDYGIPEGAFSWEVATGDLTNPQALASVQPERAMSSSTDKIVEWDVTQWITTPALLRDLRLVVRNASEEDIIYLDYVYVVVTYIVPLE